MLPNKWGQGQIFAFSALDGDSFVSDDLCGTFTGDRIGVRFRLKVKRELAFVNLPVGPFFDVVSSDWIVCRFSEEEKLKLVFVRRNLIIGQTAGGAYASVFTEGAHALMTENGCEIQDTGNGEFTCIKRAGEKFAFSFAHSRADAVRLAEEGIGMDIGAEEMKKIAHCIALTAKDFEGTAKEVHETVAAICEKFPLYK